MREANVLLVEYDPKIIELVGEVLASDKHNMIRVASTRLEVRKAAQEAKVRRLLIDVAVICAVSDNMSREDIPGDAVAGSRVAVATLRAAGIEPAPLILGFSNYGLLDKGIPVDRDLLKPHVLDILDAINVYQPALRGAS